MVVLAERIHLSRVHRPPRALPPTGSASGWLVLDDARWLQGVADLRWRIDELMPPGAASLVVDIGGLSRLSSGTLAALLLAQRRCRVRGGQVLLIGANRRCRDLLARTGLDDVLHVLADGEEIR